MPQSEAVNAGRTKRKDYTPVRTRTSCPDGTESNKSTIADTVHIKISTKKSSTKITIRRSNIVPMRIFPYTQK